MSSIYLARAANRSTEWFDYPRKRIVESQSRDAFGSHRIVQSPDDADVVLFATNDIFAPAGLGVLAEPTFRRHFSRSLVVNSDDYPSPIIGGLCPSWPCSDATAGRAIGWCYHHPNAAEATLLPQPWPVRPRYLWSFCGSQVTHLVREKLMKTRDPEAFCQDTSRHSLANLSGQTSATESAQFIREYAALLASSAFIACPRGRGASSMRIFEAMRAGRAPVIMSDEWMPPPFIAWEHCSLRLPEKEISRLPDFLRENRANAPELGRRANEEWNRVFGPSGLFHHTVEACLAILRSRPGDFNFQTFKRLWILVRLPWRRQILRRLAGR
jgi:hypothetical protein